MEPRLNYVKEEPLSYQAMAGLETYLKGTGLDEKLVELIKIRTSQINGCAFCLDMYTKDARAIGETEQRIYCLNAWRDAPFYSDEERAALELTEALTEISRHGVPDELYERVRKYFTAQQYVQLLMAINTINAWNRLSIATGAVPGNYQSSRKK